MRFLKLLLFSLFFLNATQTFAQTETYDIAAFTPPKDWKRQEGELAVSFSKVNESNGKFCLIAVYPSRASSGEINAEFQNEWRDRVAKPLSTKAKPDVQKVAAPAGWEAVIGAAKVVADSGEMATLLTVYRGHGRVLSVLISLNDMSYEKDFTDFLGSLELSKAASNSSNQNRNRQNTAASANGLVGSWGDVTSGDFGVRSGGGISTGRGGTGRSFSFKSDGTYTNTIYADVVFNSSKIQTHEIGTYKVNGDTLTFYPTKIIYKRNGVNEAPNADWRDPRSYKWRIEQDGEATNLVLITGSFEDRFLWNR
jgi:hypothetical protein